MTAPLVMDAQLNQIQVLLSRPDEADTRLRRLFDKLPPGVGSNGLRVTALHRALALGDWQR